MIFSQKLMCAWLLLCYLTCTCGAHLQLQPPSCTAKQCAESCFCADAQRFVNSLNDFLLSAFFSKGGGGFKHFDLHNKCTTGNASVIYKWWKLNCHFNHFSESPRLRSAAELLPPYIVQASLHWPLCPRKHIQEGVIISQDVEIEDSPVHASLWAFCHERFVALVSRDAYPHQPWAMCLCHLEPGACAARSTTVGFWVFVSF